MLRSETKSQIDKLWTEGTVHVQQEPAKPDEKGVDIQGDTLQMTGNPDGNFLVVTGDLAKLRMDKIYILGPEIRIDQANNKAWVIGVGAMQMESNTTFGGNKTESTVPLLVYWKDSMLFFGKFAEFHGSIQAEQGKDRLTCEALQVFFDRPISLKQGNPGDKQAKVQSLMCDKSVCIEETIMEGDRLVKWQQLIASAVETYALEDEEEDANQGRQVQPARPGTPAKNEGNQVKASAARLVPGIVRIYQPSGSDPLTQPANGQGGQSSGASQPQQQGKTNANKKPGEEEMKLTYISFGKSMQANNRTNKANFWENVRVLNMPSDDPKKDIDLDTMLRNMPRDAFYLSCDHLQVLTRKENGRTSQEMEAKQHDARPGPGLLGVLRDDDLQRSQGPGDLPRQRGRAGPVIPDPDSGWTARGDEGQEDYLPPHVGELPCRRWGLHERAMRAEHPFREPVVAREG